MCLFLTIPHVVTRVHLTPPVFAFRATVQEDSGGQCRGGAASFTERYPHLIPEEPRIQHAHDLFKYWEKVGAEK